MDASGGGAGLSDAIPANDPVGDPRGYQELLLGFLGERDPGAVQREFPAQVEEVLGAAGPALLRVRPEPDEWSVLECVAHLVQAEIVYSARYRWIIAHDEPPLLGYDQDLWVDRLHGGDDDPELLMTVLRALRAANLDLWDRSSEEERARVGMHAERGPESFDLSFRLIAGHGIFHLRQAWRALDEVRRQQG